MTNPRSDICGYWEMQDWVNVALVQPSSMARL